MLIWQFAVLNYALFVLLFPCSIPRIHAVCYPELPCTYTARLAPPVIKQASKPYTYDHNCHYRGMPICVALKTPSAA